MPTWLFVAVVAALWVITGVTAAVTLLGRKGYRDWTWYLVGALLGPVFVPVAAERARDDTRTLERTTVSERGRESTNGVTVLVAADGSAESDQAIRDAATLIAGTADRVVLATVVDSEAHLAQEQTAAARELLTARTAWLPADGPEAVVEIGSGRPATVLLDLAKAEGADLIIMGRRGRGLSRRLLGSVANDLVKHAPVPVLLAAPPATDTADHHRS